MAKEETSAAQVVGMPPELLALLLERLGQPQLDTAQLAEILKQTGLTTASAMQKALKPENAFHPGVSCYSYPEGDRDKPRQELKCAMSWANAPIVGGCEGNMHWYELELLNQQEPGLYQVTRTDMTQTLLTVTGASDATGKLESLSFTFPLRGRGERHNVAPLAVWLLEALGLSYMEAMQKYLTVHIADTAAKTRKAVAA
jgi:hypothetical protein